MFYLQGQRFDFRFVDIDADEKFLLPTITLTFHRSSKQDKDKLPQDAVITNINMKISIKPNDYVIKVIGLAKSKVLQQTWKFDNESNLEFYLVLDHHMLYEIEKIRNNGNLHFLAELDFQMYPVDHIQEMKPYSIPIEFMVLKSAWVEEILPKLKYKNVALVEMPRLDYPRLDEAIGLLDRAWRSYSSGDIDDVLVKCRMVLEGLKLQVMAASFVKNEPAKDKEGHEFMKKVPDWNIFLDSQSKGDIIKNTMKSMLDFVAPGAHVGGILVVNHAYFALLQTFSLTHLITSRFKMIDEMKTPGQEKKSNY